MVGGGSVRAWASLCLRAGAQPCPPRMQAPTTSKRRAYKTAAMWERKSASRCMAFSQFSSSRPSSRCPSPLWASKVCAYFGCVLAVLGGVGRRPTRELASLSPGGPLEVKKRAAMHPLLYIENFLWLMLLGWTGKGTWRSVGGDCVRRGDGMISQGGDTNASVRSRPARRAPPARSVQHIRCSQPQGPHRVLEQQPLRHGKRPGSVPWSRGYGDGGYLAGKSPHGPADLARHSARFFLSQAPRH